MKKSVGWVPKLLADDQMAEPVWTCQTFTSMVWKEGEVLDRIIIMDIMHIMHTTETDSNPGSVLKRQFLGL